MNDSITFDVTAASETGLKSVSIVSGGLHLANGVTLACFYDDGTFLKHSEQSVVM